jgi:hypothetical protein
LLRQVCVRTIMCFTKVYIIPHTYIWVRIIVINSPFDNISVISWRSVVLVDETGVPGEKYQLVASNWQMTNHIMLYQVHLIMSGIHKLCIHFNRKKDK